MNYTAATYSNINPVVFYGGGFCGGVDPRREQYAGEDVAGVEVPDYKTKYEALQNVIKDNYQLFEVDYYGVDNDNYVDGEGFCCEPQANTRKGRSLPTENVDYEKLQYYYHSDHLGSASYITNLDGEVVQHIEYVPFGEVFLEERNNTWNTPFLFNGKELDEETGLYYYGARYYNPKTSQFLSTDRYAEKYPDASPYQYCLNNPVNALEINGDSITVANNPTSIGDVNSLVSANNQQYITFTGDGSFSQVGLNFGDKSQEDINNLLSSDEGLSLLNDVINASENYLYEASEIALLRDEAGNRKGVAMFMDSNGVVNASNGGADSNGAHTFRPASGYDGHVVLSIDGSWNEVNSSGTAIVSKSRSSMVFHEIAESYERTTNGINYHGSGSNRGAHSRAVSRENSWHGKSQSPGGIAPNGYSNPNTMRTHGLILNSINNHYLNSGNGLR